VRLVCPTRRPGPGSGTLQPPPGSDWGSGGGSYTGPLGRFDFIGVTFTIGGRDDSDEPVELSIETESQNGKRLVQISVRDHGPGIPDGERSIVFEPFWTSKAKGTGLGLAVVGRIVDAHGGTVELTEAPGGGALVRVVLPADGA